MAELAGSPWRGNTVIRVTNSTGGGTRHFRLAAVPNLSSIASATAFDGDQNWSASPGGEVLGPNEERVTLAWDTLQSVTAPPQATVARIRAYVPGTSTQVGAEKVVTISGNEGTEIIGFFFDTDPFDGDGNEAPRAGMLEWYLEVESDSGINSWGPADSRGGFANPGVRVHDYANGMARAPVTLTAHTLSNIAIDGAEPSTLAYPDPVYVKASFEHPFYESNSMVAYLMQGGDVINAKVGSTTGTDVEFSFTSNSNLVDQSYTIGDVDLQLQFGFETFGGTLRYVWDGSQPAGWTGIPSQRELDYENRIPVDPTVSIVNEVFDNPTTSVFNRGETTGGEFEVHNARNETFNPVGTETVKVKRVSNGAIEETASISRNAGVTSWDVTFGTSGNNAPADDVGDAKILEWDDVATSMNTGKPTSSQFGLLSSLYNVEPHMQLNDSNLDPNLNTEGRPTDQIGFFSVRVTNQRGQAVDGAVGDLALQDDGELKPAQEYSNLTTATINGHAGYTPLKAWESSLPGGAWDLYSPAGFTKNGNTGLKPQSTLDQSGDFTLFAQNPNLVVVGSAGHSDFTKMADHIKPGDGLIFGFGVFNNATKTAVKVDDSTDLDPGGQPYPKSEAIIVRFNTLTGRAEYLDGLYEWQLVEGPGSMHAHRLLSIKRANELQGNGSYGDERAYIAALPEGTSSDWEPSVLMIMYIAEVFQFPYSATILIDLTGGENKHSGYGLDAMGLALHGIIGLK